MRLFPSLVILCAAFVGATSAQNPSAESRPTMAAEAVAWPGVTRRVDPRLYGIGEWVAPITHKENAFDIGKKAGLVVVTGFADTAHAHDTKKLAALLAACTKNDFLALYVTDTLRDAAEAPGWHYVTDPEHAFLRGLGTDESAAGDIFVIDRKRTLVYRGALDAAPFAATEMKESWAIDAVRAAAGNEPAEIPATAYTFRPVVARTDRTDAKALTYHREIERLFEARCNLCHREGGNAPFAFTRYTDVKKRATMIAKVVEDRLMPPWPADKRNSCEFQNDRSLSDRERTRLLAWIDAGAVEGDPADQPIARHYTKGWVIGTPDAVISIPKPYQVPASGVVQYKYCYVKTSFDTDKWIQKMEIRCKEPQVVHHVLVFLEEPPADESGNGRRRRFGPGFQAGLEGYFAGLVPGGGTSIWLDGRGKKLPKGATLKFQIHYTPNGKAVEDTVEMGFKFYDGAPEREILTHAATQVMLRIPPGKADYTTTSKFNFRRAGTIWSFAPHMHVRGAAYKYELTFPDGSKLTPLDIPKWDFNWQYRYELARPIHVPKGTKMVATAVFDNSDKNPANPDPTKTVIFGEQTFDEMMIGYFEFTPDAGGEND